jgi:hypothetical protein
LMRVLQDLESLRQREKDQLKNAFNKGLIYGMSFNPAEGQQVSDGFDQFYKTEYLDD